MYLTIEEISENNKTVKLMQSNYTLLEELFLPNEDEMNKFELIRVKRNIQRAKEFYKKHFERVARQKHSKQGKTTKHRDDKDSFCSKYRGVKKNLQVLTDRVEFLIKCREEQWNNGLLSNNVSYNAV